MNFDLQNFEFNHYQRTHPENWKRCPNIFDQDREERIWFSVFSFQLIHILWNFNHIPKSFMTKFEGKFSKKIREGECHLNPNVWERRYVNPKNWQSPSWWNSNKVLSKKFYQCRKVQKYTNSVNPKIFLRKNVLVLVGFSPLEKKILVLKISLIEQKNPTYVCILTRENREFYLIKWEIFWVKNISA